VGQIVITETDRRKAFALFDQGETVGRVATMLFAGHWYKAKKLRDEYEAQKEPAAAAPAAEELIAEAEPEPEPETALELARPETSIFEPEIEDEPEVWDITLQVPAKRMDQILLTLSPQEKANAISGVLQSRLDAES